MYGTFITATNTDRGKSLVTAAITLYLSSTGLRTLPFKPIQTGVQGLYDGDIGFTLSFSDKKPPQEVLELMQPFRYEMPASPHLAAQQESKPLPSLADIKAKLTALQNHCDFVVTEGAGGIMVPINLKTNTTMAELAKTLEFPVILVCQSELGAINDAALSIEAMQKRSLPILGFLFNDTHEALNETIVSDNAATIELMTGERYLGRMPFLDKLSANTLLAAMENMSTLKHSLKELYAKK